jgi:Ca2+/Na+ antiporter
MFMHIIQDGVSTTIEAFSMVFLYLTYVTFVCGRYVWSIYNNTDDLTGALEETKQLEPRFDEKNPLLSVDVEMSPHSSSKDDPSPTTANRNNKEHSSPPSPNTLIPVHHEEDLIDRIASHLTPITHPLQLFFTLTIPSLRSRLLPILQHPSEAEMTVHAVNAHRYAEALSRRPPDPSCALCSPALSCQPLTATAQHVSGVLHASLCRSLMSIFVCVVYISLFSFLIVQASDVIVTHIGLSQTTVGATLVSLGTEV